MEISEGISYVKSKSSSFDWLSGILIILLLSDSLDTNLSPSKIVIIVALRCSFWGLSKVPHVIN